LSEEELLELVNVYPRYEVDKEYKEGDLFSWHGTLYEVLQDHTSQVDWKPDSSPSLYVSKMPEGVIPEWTQPAGGHDAYALEDKVIHNEQVWISTVDDNVWEPGVYGWEIVED